jgi:hypothetical protein
MAVDPPAPDFRSCKMPFFRVLAVLGLAVLTVSSLAVGNGAYAGPAAAGSAVPKAQVAPVVTKEVQPTREVGEEAPIVMGRSVGVVRKSKLHHIKAKPAHPGDPAKN